MTLSLICLIIARFRGNSVIKGLVCLCMRVAKLSNVQINSLLYCPGTAAVKSRDVMLHPVPRSNFCEVLGLGSIGGKVMEWDRSRESKASSLVLPI